MNETKKEKRRNGKKEKIYMKQQQCSVLIEKLNLFFFSTFILFSLMPTQGYKND
jgi:hypothetical protein